MLYLPKNKVAVIPMSDPDMVGSIYVPEQAKERSDQGVVKYVGPGVENVEIGDHVFFSGYDGSQVAIEGEGILIFLDAKSIVAAIHLGINPRVPGVWLQDTDGGFFPATFEATLEALARALADGGALEHIRTGKRAGRASKRE